MNESGDYVFISDYTRHCQLNGWFGEPESNKLHADDYNKYYTSCLMSDYCTFGWPVYSVFDEVKSFDGEIEAGYYYINIENFFPLKGAGWYDADLVYYAFQCKLMEKEEYIISFYKRHRNGNLIITLRE
jgi:hypothetical protein